jgi:hypothetical protein
MSEEQPSTEEVLQDLREEAEELDQDDTNKGTDRG